MKYYLRIIIWLCLVSYLRASPAIVTSSGGGTSWRTDAAPVVTLGVTSGAGQNLHCVIELFGAEPTVVTSAVASNGTSLTADTAQFNDVGGNHWRWYRYSNTAAGVTSVTFNLTVIGGIDFGIAACALFTGEAVAPVDTFDLAGSSGFSFLYWLTGTLNTSTADTLLLAAVVQNAGGVAVPCDQFPYNHLAAQVADVPNGQALTLCYRVAHVVLTGERGQGSGSSSNIGVLAAYKGDGIVPPSTGQHLRSQVY